jgi:hypothetical protein
LAGASPRSATVKKCAPARWAYLDTAPEIRPVDSLASTWSGGEIPPDFVRALRPVTC